MAEVASLEEPRRRGSSVGFVSRRLGQIVRSQTSNTLQESDDSIRGPLGLNLLHEPSETRIDFVFVHGLEGGSRKTWSDTPDRAAFWPKEWLPSEAGFKHVRIHSYGYNSQWGLKKDSRLSIHDFGQDLLANLYNSPHLQKNINTPIVIVAHSMGGLVAKKAVLLSERDPMYHGIAARFHSVYFLATPHRGADSAQQLGSLLKHSFLHGRKEYVKELIPGSGTLQVINDEFRHVCGNIQLWSFFEGVETSMPHTSGYIVDRESAIVGLPTEHVQSLNADHRHVCKFKTPEDPNYIILYRSFMTTIQELEKNHVAIFEGDRRAEMKQISLLLEIPQRPEADLVTVTDKQYKGSCSWLSDKVQFQDWLEVPKEPQDTNPFKKQSSRNALRYLWLNGPPGTGKSVASGHVIRYLEGCNSDCSFYFFRHNSKSRSPLSELLRSLAFQMAESNFEVRKSFLAMIQNEECLNKDDYTMIWRTFFMSRIFNIQFPQPQYWVIDAVDECSSKVLPLFFQMLAKIDSKVSLRVFITSRPGGLVERLFEQEKLDKQEIRMDSGDSLRDIELFLRAKWRSFDDEELSNKLISDILKKSNGIFLWASLIMTQLEDTYSIEDMNEAFKNVPSEMNDLYTRILTKVAESPSAEIAKAIMKWVICAPQPLTTTELKGAIQMDISRTLTVSESQLETICGHLIFVDKQARVHAIHQTFTSFLTKEVSEFKVDRSLANARIAEVCLSHLNGKQFTTPRLRRGIVIPSPVEALPFSVYASNHFPEHLASSSSALDPPLILLDTFLRTNVLSWIEQAARAGSLQLLIKAAGYLKVYLNRRAKYRSPLGKEFQLVNSWVNDFVHITAAFGPNLLESPSSIHYLTPPLCPSTSAIYTNFSKSRHYKVMGSSEQEWDDRLSCFIYPQEALSVACSNHFLAVGLATGDIIIYDGVTFETVKTMQHGEPVRLLAFGTLSSLLASSGSRKVMLWDSHQACIWHAQLDATDLPIALGFNADDTLLMLPNKENRMATFQVREFSRLSDCEFYSNGSESDSSGEEDRETLKWNPPWQARLSAVHNLIAISYRNRPIHIWDLERQEKIGIFEKEGSEDQFPSPQANDMVFNPNPELSLLAIAYNDGDLIICDPWAREQVSKYEITVQVTAASPDGRTLATGGTDGVIHLFTFETLRLIFRITALDDKIMGIVFASNSLRFFDIRGYNCNVWEPSVLIQKDGADDNSSEHQSEEISPPIPDMAFARLFEDEHSITTITQVIRGDFIFCGREDGYIDLFEAGTGKMVKQFLLHKRLVPTRLLEWNAEKSILVSVDASSRFILTQFSATTTGMWQEAEMLLEGRASEVILQVLLAEKESRFLLSTTTYDQLWDIKQKTLVTTSFSYGEKRQWISHPTNPKHLILLKNGKAYSYNWETLQRLSDVSGTSLNCRESLPIESERAWCIRAGYSLCVKLIPSAGSNDARLFSFDASQISPDLKEAQVTIIHMKLFSGVKCVIGLYKSLLYFVDNKGWVCSVNIKGVQNAEYYLRHFFIPFTWHRGSDLVLRVLPKGNIAFGHRNEVVIFYGFLDFEEKVHFDKRSR